MTSILTRAWRKFRSHGLAELAYAVIRHAFPRRAACFAPLAAEFSGAIGLELGGPSAIFSRRGLLPVYGQARRIDNCNFGRETLWEGLIQEGTTFQFRAEGERGRQFVADATNLDFIQDSSYNFVLSSHTLEHIANPLKALNEWVRVLATGGLLMLVLPNRQGTFDHRRPITTFKHLLDDFEQDMREDDLTHLDEVLALHDLTMDPEAGDIASFAARSRRNFENRSLHHHVFDESLAVEVVDYFGLDVLAVDVFRPYNILVVARKHDPLSKIGNERSMLDSAGKHILG